ncbi:MAG: hypothetical protein K5774_02810 [Clostridia bacterium]|nr:hypothetical protein [Clostridia bacterium]
MSETRTIRIEVLFPEVACLYGDLFNVKYLASSIKDSGYGAEVINTSLKDTPAFVSGDVDMVYMGPMPEYAQELALEVLMPLKERIAELIEAGKVFLFTGNAFEIFGEYIERDDGSRIDCLGIYEGRAVRRMMKRYNSLYLGKFGEMDIIGFKSQFSKTFDVPAEKVLFKTVRECEPEDTARDEGVHIGNFFGTYLLGPFLIVCPNFTRYIMGLLGIGSPVLTYEEEAMYCYDERMKDFLDPTKDFH